MLSQYLHYYLSPKTKKSFENKRRYDKMSLFDNLFKMLLDRFSTEKELTAEYLQYHHKGSCGTPCRDCPERDKRIYKNGEHIRLPAHPHCDCYYTNVETKPLGSISQRQPSPDI